MVDLVPLASVDPATIEALLDEAFGSDRHMRTAYRIRGTACAIDTLSFAAVDGGILVGTIQCWPVVLAGDDGSIHDLVMVGPVAVTPSRQRDGIGRLLVTRCLAAADAGVTDKPLMLIGDPEYYGRFFGFTAERTALWRLPGPVERRRLLARGGGLPDLGGELGPVPSEPARTFTRRPAVPTSG